MLRFSRRSWLWTLRVRSSLSVPPYSNRQAIGALNLYAATPHAFDDPTEIAQVSALAAQADAVLSVVTNQADQVQLTEQLREALPSRSAIDQAIGILMGHQRCTATEAFALLRTASQHGNRKLRDIAADIVTSVSGQPPEPSPFDQQH